MAEDGMMRASDADRDAVVSVLRDAYAAGRLTLEEFRERTSAAYAGRTWGELRELTSDLPEQPSFAAGLPPQPAAPPEPADLPPGAGRLPEQPSPAERPGRRQRPAGAVMPFVMIWFLIVLSTRSPAAAAAPVVVLVLLLLFTALTRRK